MIGDRDFCVRCPIDPPRMEPRQTCSLDVALNVLQRFRVSDPPHLERALSTRLWAAFAESGETSIPFHIFNERPAVEPVLLEVWPELVRKEMPPVSDLTSDLLGRPAIERQGPSATVRCLDGTRSVFPPPAEAAGWLHRLQTVEAARHPPFAQACFAYAQTALSHPYNDGNGRLARAMYQRSLARSGLLAGPYLPLGPLVYASHRVHDRALQHLGSTGDWGPFVGVILGLTRKAAAFTAWTFSGERSLPYQSP
jgi:hypothetical protein